MIWRDAERGKKKRNEEEKQKDKRNRHIPSRLAQHVHHLGLEDGIHGLDRHTGSRLRHGKDVDDAHRVVVDKLSQHQPHDFHGHTGASVAEHLEEGERGNVDCFAVVDNVAVLLRATAAATTTHALSGGQHSAEAIHIGLDESWICRCYREDQSSRQTMRADEVICR